MKALKSLLVTIAVCALWCAPASGLMHGFQNPGNIQISLGLGDTPQFFINWFKSVPGVSYNGNTPLVQDANGYPNLGPVTSGVGILEAVPSMPTSAYYSGTWEIGFTGTGGIQVQGQSLSIMSDPQGCYSATGNIVGTNCDVVFSYPGNPSSNYLFPSNITYSNMGGAFLIRTSDRAAYLAGQVITPEWVDVLKRLNPLAIRTMGLTFPNQANAVVASWNYRTPVAAFSYLTQIFFQNLISPSITGTDQYTASAATDTPAQWTDGEMLQGNFPNSSAPALTITGAASNGGLVRLTMASTGTLSTNQNVLVANAFNNGAAPKVYAVTVIDGTHIDLQGSTYSASWLGSGQVTTTTINVAGRGAKFIVPGQILGSVGINGGQFATMTYDGLLDLVLLAANGEAMQPGVPIEVLVSAANTVGKPLWWNIPPLYTTAAVSAEAAYVCSHSSQASYVEYDNETWNFGLGGTFPGAQWFLQRGLALGLGGISSGQAQNSYVGLKVRQNMAAVTAACGSRVKRINAAQATGFAPNIDLYQFQGSLLCGTSCGNSIYQNSPYAGVDYNVSPNRPIDYSDAISAALYFQGCQVSGNNGTLVQLNGIITAATQYAAGDTVDAFAFMDSDTRAGTWSGGGSCSGVGSTLAQVASDIEAQWNTVANSENKPFYAYEGGYQGVGQSSAYLTSIGDANASVDATNIANLIIAYRGSSPIKQTVLDWNHGLFSNITLAKGNSWLTVEGPGIWSLLQGGLMAASQFQTFDGVSFENHSSTP